MSSDTDDITWARLVVHGAFPRCAAGCGREWVPVQRLIDEMGRPFLACLSCDNTWGGDDGVVHALDRVPPPALVDAEVIENWGHFVTYGGRDYELAIA